MNGIKDLLILYHWMSHTGNEQTTVLKVSWHDEQAIPKDRLAILQELEKEKAAVANDRMSKFAQANTGITH